MKQGKSIAAKNNEASCGADSCNTESFSRTIKMPKICSVCLSSDILCARCKSLADSGGISDTEIRVARAVHALGKEIGMQIDFLRAVAADSTVVVLAGGGNAGKLIGTGGRNARRLSQLLNSEVRIIQDAPERRLIENIMRIQLLGINKIYGDREAYRLRIKRQDRERAQKTLGLAERLLGKKVLLFFE